MIPWAKPDYWGKERQYVSEAMESTWISGGPFVEKLEQYFSELSGGGYALAVSNGTTAIQLAYLALDIQHGDEIIVPGFGFLAAANVALNFGATPIFCEVDPHTWCMSASDVERRITPRTKAIVVVHNYGNVCDMDSILQLAKGCDIPVIEDSAEAFPSLYRNRLAGTIGDIGTFSFQATKTITTGEGGMVVTRAQAMYERMALYRSHGLRRKKHYWHEVPGLNFRLTNIQAALGCAQLEELNKIVAERQRVYTRYLSRLTAIRGLSLQAFQPEVSPTVWAIAVKLDLGVFHRGRDWILDQMLNYGIELRPGFYSPAQLEYFDCPPMPICDDLASSIISLPSYPSLTDLEIDFICDRLDQLGRM